MWRTRITGFSERTRAAILLLVVGSAACAVLSWLSGGVTTVRIGGTENLSRVYPPASKAASGVIISLHTWSGDFTQEDPMLAEAQSRGWGYIRPNLGGPNRLPASCLAPSVIDGLDAVVDFCRDEWGVAPEKIHLVGHSGGGFTALGYWHLGRRTIASVQAWNPISDLASWHVFCSGRPGLRKYAGDIESAIGGKLDARLAEARSRSPLHMPVPAGRKMPPLRIFAGIRDGHEGSVPVSQSTDYFNRLASHGLATPIPDNVLVAIHSGRIQLLSNLAQPVDNGMFRFGNRGVALYVFDGAHEMLVDESWDMLSDQ